MPVHNFHIFLYNISITSQGSSSVPAGTICIWHGSVASIPSGWALCNGDNNTPDLRSRFVYGAGGDSNTKISWSNGWNSQNGHLSPGWTGGEEQHILSVAEIPSHSHYWNGGALVSLAAGGLQYDVVLPFMGAAFTSNEGGNQPHNIMPRFMVLAYIMKL